MMAVDASDAAVDVMWTRDFRKGDAASDAVVDEMWNQGTRVEGTKRVGVDGRGTVWVH
jgi:hypothetical protein